MIQSRVIAKYKRDEFKETQHVREITPEKLKILENAKEIAEEWVTSERLNHVLTRSLVEKDIKNTGKIIQLMIEDVLKESKGEIINSLEARKEIGKQTGILFKKILNFGENNGKNL